MGARELGFSLLFFTYLIHSVSSSPVQKTLPSEFMQKSKIEDRDVYGSKIGGGNSHGGTGGGKTPNNGENGGSNTQGGAAIIPVYVAGAANNNHHHQNHHGAGNCNLKRLKFPTLLMIVSVYTLIQLCLIV